MSKQHWNTTHGCSRNQTYQAWNNMHTRCYNPGARNFERYGGRGISMCKRWAKFKNFLADMGECPAGLSLDRKDNDKNYTKANYRWATVVEQANNKSNNRILEIDGKKLNVTQWANKYNINYKTIFTRLDRGWSVKDAVTVPTKTYWSRHQKHVSAIRS